MHTMVLLTSAALHAPEIAKLATLSMAALHAVLDISTLPATAPVNAPTLPTTARPAPTQAHAQHAELMVPISSIPPMASANNATLAAPLAVALLFASPAQMDST